MFAEVPLRYFEEGFTYERSNGMSCFADSLV